MKTLFSIVIIAVATALPAASFAQQTNGSLTRAEVRTELNTAQQGGQVHQSKTQYPKAAPSTRANVVTNDTSGYGPVMAGSSQAATASMGTQRSLFSHH